MNQQDTIFDNDFDKQNAPRRRELMPKWLIVYMWIVIIFGIGMLAYAAFSIPVFDTNDARAHDPENGGAYRTGAWIGQFIPGILILFMGELVRSEKKSAIRFNLGVAIVWTAYVMLMVLAAGPRALLIGMLIPVFVPYWIGLFSIQRKWEKEAVGGARRF